MYTDPGPQTSDGMIHTDVRWPRVRFMPLVRLTLPRRLKTHIHINRLPYPGHENFLRALAKPPLLGLSSPRVQVLGSPRDRKFVPVVSGSVPALGAIGFAARAAEDNEVERPEGGEARADDDAVDFGAGRGLVAWYGGRV